MLESIEKPSDRTLYKMEILKEVEKKILESNLKESSDLTLNKPILNGIFEPYTSYKSMVKGLNDYIAKQIEKTGFSLNPQQIGGRNKNVIR